MFNVPLPSLLRNVFSAFRQLLGSIFGIFGSRGIPHFQRKREEKESIRKRLGRGTLKTCAKFQGLSLKNGAEIWTLVRQRAKITAWHRTYLVLVYTRFCSLNMTQYWSYAVSSSNICAKLSTCLGAPGSGSSRKKKRAIFFCLPRKVKCLTIIDLLECL